MSRGPHVDLASASDVGRIRSRNEDHYAIADLTKHMHLVQSNLADATESNDRCGHVLLVADGMGGVAGGQRASELAIRSLLDRLVEDIPWFLDGRGETAHAERAERDATAREALQRALLSSHREIIETAQRELEHRGMGTTLTMALVVWPDLHVAHVGDSRCYLLRGRRLEQLTHDDTLAQRLLDGGSMSRDEARSSRLAHLLTQVLGGSGDDELTPQVAHRLLRAGDLLLLSTDGVHGELSDRELERMALEAPDAQSLCQRVIEAANRAGGRDNATLVVARFTDEQRSEETATP